jgi:hypothetical protein
MCTLYVLGYVYLLATSIKNLQMHDFEDKSKTILDNVYSYTLHICLLYKSNKTV